MRYKRLGNSSLEVSVVGLGTWAIGEISGERLMTKDPSQPYKGL